MLSKILRQNESWNNFSKIMTTQFIDNFKLSCIVLVMLVVLYILKLFSIDPRLTSYTFIVAAGGCFRMVKEYVATNKTAEVKKLLRVLGQEFALSQNANSRKGGLIGLAASAIALGKVWRINLV